VFVFLNTVYYQHGFGLKDLMRRLEVLMWTDWHSDVRLAAAQALAGTGTQTLGSDWSTTGRGLVIHDSLLDRMTHSSPTVRSDAVRRLGQLGQLLRFGIKNEFQFFSFFLFPSRFFLSFFFSIIPTKRSGGRCRLSPCREKVCSAL